MAEQLGVERGDDVCGPPDALGFGLQSTADNIDEISDVAVDCAIGAWTSMPSSLATNSIASNASSKSATKAA